MHERVIVALSGGVDSTMAAYLLQEKGYDVTGIHLRLVDDDDSVTLKRLGIIAKELGIQIIYYDAHDIFKQEVISYFTSFHLAGYTPSPCAYCNPFFKWKLFQQVADSMDIRTIATGHYINIQEFEGNKRIFKATDKFKDQSYYLWGLSKEIIQRSITPLGSVSKEELIAQAKRKGFDFLLEPAESTGLCFAKGKDIREVLHNYVPDELTALGEGNVVDADGRVIGRHSGYPIYTIGQKRGLDLYAKQELCVAEIIPETNLLVAKSWEQLYTHRFTFHQAHFFDAEELNSSDSMQVLVRGFGLNPGGNCRVNRISTDLYNVILDEPAWAVAPGQPAVFYSGNRLLGGGIIAREATCR
jgi:tRNA-uridine 2-sulfurtransferase